ncbi:MAG: beta-N-acetylhexosaminidase [Thermoactinomyces sp.]
MDLRPGYLKYIAFCFVFLLFVQTACSQQPEPASEPKPENLSKWVDEQLAAMSLDEKIGQMFIAGFKGKGSDEQALAVNEQARTLVKDYHVGGIIYFDRNVESPTQVARLSNDLQKLALSTERKIPLFITVDQEGGKVARLKQGFTSYPGNMALGASRSKELAFQTGRQMGLELKAVGINLNMAPVMDVNNNPQNPVIGVRSFSENPELTAELGSEMIRGFHESGILTIAKHFPGHGDTAVDSHVGLPEIPHSMDRLDKLELVPFKRAIAANTDMVMSTHITFPALEPTPGLPATLSKHVLTGLLRDQLNYNGVIITDDMEMGAIAENFGTSEAAVRAVQAGADIVLVCHSLDRQTESIKAVKQAVEQGKIDEKRIDASVRRILSLKAKDASFLSNPYVDVQKADQLTARPDAAKVARQTAEQGVTLVTDPEQLIPLDTKQKLAVFTVNKPKAITGVLKQQGYDATVSFIDKLSVSQIPSLLTRAKEADAVLIAMNQGKDTGTWIQFVQRLRSENIPVVVWAMDVPYGLGNLPRGTASIALYGSSEPLLEAGAKILSGEIKSQGQLPVTVSERFPFGWPENENR